MDDEPRKQVLCVDDEPDVIYRIKKVIERRYPVDVWTADNGYTALGMMSKHHFDVVLLDVSMPGISGLEVCAEIIAKYPKTQVIIVTGSGDYELLARAKGARFLVKPVSMDDIRALIHECLDLI